MHFEKKIIRKIVESFHINHYLCLYVLFVHVYVRACVCVYVYVCSCIGKMGINRICNVLSYAI